MARVTSEEQIVLSALEDPHLAAVIAWLTKLDEREVKAALKRIVTDKEHVDLLERREEIQHEHLDALRAPRKSSGIKLNMNGRLEDWMRSHTDVIPEKFRYLYEN